MVICPPVSPNKCFYVQYILKRKNILSEQTQQTTYKICNMNPFYKKWCIV